MSAKGRLWCSSMATRRAPPSSGPPSISWPRPAGALRPTTSALATLKSHRTADQPRCEPRRTHSMRYVTMVVGDWGGPIGLAWARANPDRLRAPVITNTWLWPVNRSLCNQGFSKVMGGPIGRHLTRRHDFFAGQVVKAAWGKATPLTSELHAEFTSVHRTPGDRKGMWVFPQQIVGGVVVAGVTVGPSRHPSQASHDAAVGHARYRLSAKHPRDLGTHLPPCPDHSPRKRGSLSRPGSNRPTGRSGSIPDLSSLTQRLPPGASR